MTSDEQFNLDEGDITARVKLRKLVSLYDDFMAAQNAEERGKCLAELLDDWVLLPDQWKSNVQDLLRTNPRPQKGAPRNEKRREEIIYEYFARRGNGLIEPLEEWSVAVEAISQKYGMTHKAAQNEYAKAKAEYENSGMKPNFLK